jgi:hypothetical protein
VQKSKIRAGLGRHGREIETGDRCGAQTRSWKSKSGHTLAARLEKTEDREQTEPAWATWAGNQNLARAAGKTGLNTGGENQNAEKK